MDAPRLLKVNLVTVKERILAILHIDFFKGTSNIRDICFHRISLINALPFPLVVDKFSCVCPKELGSCRKNCNIG